MRTRLINEVGMVLIKRISVSCEHRRVALDDRAVHVLATRHLIQQGHTYWVYLLQPIPSLDAEDRLRGYDALAETPANDRLMTFG